MARILWAPQDPLSREQNAKALELLTSDLVRQINAKYYHWTQVKRIASQQGEDPQVLWYAAKWGRLAQLRSLTLEQEGGKALTYSITPTINDRLHRVDLETAGQIGLTSSADHSLLTDPDARPRYIIRSLMDEAIESSLLEGAVGTRRDARRMLREKREPRNPSERMIANNYSAMQHVKTRLKEPLTLDLLHSVHEILMRDMMAEEELGAFRTAYDDVRVEDEGSGEVLHQPPPAAGLEERMQKICHFANADHREDDFIHPIVKAIILHFMIGYEHPYCDGNGRTARAIFYWSALRSGYWLFEFLVISELLRKARTGYRDAYLESERDHGDLTYFIDFNLRKIIEAIGQFEQFLENERLQTDREARISLLDSTLNARQRKLLAAALKHPGDHFTVTSHATTNGITEPTARADLNDLVDKGFMITFKDRQRVVYQLNPKVHTRLDLLISE